MASEQSSVVGESLDDYYREMRKELSPEALGELNALEAQYSSISQAMTERLRAKSARSRPGISSRK